MAVETEEAGLLAAIARGDRAAMRVFYERHSPGVFRFALARLGDGHAAEDVLQETMLAVWRGAAGFRGESRVDTWLFGICRRKIADQVRRRSLEAREDGSGAAAGESLRDSVADPGTDLEFWWAMAKLRPEERELILLAFHQGYGQKEVAEILGVPLGTVKSRLHTVRRKLGRALEGGVADHSGGHGRNGL